jgi:uncharacterized repeat protein (TIGR03803 family)
MGENMKRFKFIHTMLNMLMSMLVLLGMLLPISAEAATEFRLIQSVGKADGAPYGKLTRDASGNLYGTTYYGGSKGVGTVFKVDSSGNLSVLHEFDGDDGSNPQAGLTLGSDGYFYGTTLGGGSNGYGTIFRIDSSGSFKVLHEFDGAGGGWFIPAGLIQASDGNFYGTTYWGGTNGTGTVFKLEPSGNFTVLHSFDEINGAYPYGGLVQASDGNLYGTTSFGGSNGFGTVFKLDLSGNYSVLYEFEANINDNGNVGASPQGSLTQASDGNLYGTTTLADINSSASLGTVYKIDTSGNFTHLATLDGVSYDGLLQGSDGNFYIATTPSYGSADLYGSVYKMDSSGNLTVLHQLTGGSGGANPYAALIQGGDGYLYGTTTGGGSGSGTVFKLDLAGGFQVLHAFEGTSTPSPSNLIQASDGSFYSTTNSGGYGFGTVFQWDASGNVNVVHLFDGSDGGGYPTAELTQGSDGSFYSTTSGGGSSGSGTVFKLDPDGSFSVLHSFDGNTGTTPYAGLIEGSDGNFYGTAYYGGSYGYGTVFKLDPSSNNVTMLHEFDGVDGGAHPYAGLIQGTDGSFYGTTEYGGNNEEFLGAGTIYKIDSSGNFSVVHEFDGTDGTNPNTRLIQTTDGNFYGTTPGGGSSGAGVIYKIDSFGNFSVFHEFDGAGGGSLPNNLIQSSDGSLYGTTFYGGDINDGTVFKFDSSGNFSILHSFSGSSSDGLWPTDLIQANDGNFYGTTYYGGEFGQGVLFRLIETPDTAAITLKSSANPSLLGKAVTFTATITGNNPTGTVEFCDGETRLGVSPLVKGIAKLSTSRLKLGSHTITAVYSGDANNPESVSAPLDQVVKAATKAVLKAKPTETAVGEPVTFTAVVRGKKPTGSVEFIDGTRRLGSVPLNKSGRARLSTDDLKPGVHRMVALYRGDRKNAPSIGRILIRVGR